MEFKRKKALRLEKYGLYACVRGKDEEREQGKREEGDGRGERMRRKRGRDKMSVNGKGRV